MAASEIQQLDRPPSSPPKVTDRSIPEMASGPQDEGGPVGGRSRSAIQSQAMALQSVMAIGKILANLAQIMPEFAPTAMQATAVLESGLKQVLQGSVGNAGPAAMAPGGGQMAAPEAQASFGGVSLG